MTTPDWLADAVFYQIFPDRFANGDPALNPVGVVPWDAVPTRDNFFGGDLAGIAAHLDHLTDLGVNALYLTPVFEAGTNHRYDAWDYFAIDHRLGDGESFEALLAAAHERGIRVVLDAVLNHCGDGHWAFRDVVAREAGSSYVNWFFVEDFPVTLEPKPNFRTCSGCPYMPKWNVYNPAVRRHHYDVARYWLERGIDGWRLDVPFFVNRRFWRGFRTVVKRANPDAYIVAEEWQDPGKWLDGDTADGTMNYTLRDLILRFTADNTLDAYGYARKMSKLLDRIPAGCRTGMLNLLGSHDTERALTRHHGDRDSLALAYALLFVSAGAPMVYYGDEVGLEGGNDPLCRGAMPWDETRWDAGIYDRLRALVQVRRDSPALRRGEQTTAAYDADTIIVTRALSEVRTLAIIHRGHGVEVDLATVPGWTSDGWNTLVGPHVVQRVMSLPARGVCILENQHT
ncbi:MAG: glycoside hydrolase family 13 protein [Propionibacteriaceae bacterium]|jgi:glycosidase|nr:glycoside hydrolase family 13 protein [Propionibacteriaceae bacterium]